MHVRVPNHSPTLECTQEAISRSPVYSHLSTSLEGLAVLRAFGLEERFLRQFYNYQDTNTRIYIMFLYMSRWYDARPQVFAPARGSSRRNDTDPGCCCVWWGGSDGIGSACGWTSCA